MFITTPAYEALVPRQTNALSELISNAIGLGNSVLGDLMTSTVVSSSAASSSTNPTTTTLATSSSSQSSSSLLASASSSSPTSSSSSVASSPASSSIVPSTTSAISTTLSSVTTISTTTPSTTPTPSSHHTNKALIIALPIVLCLVALVFAFVAIWVCRRRRRNRDPSRFLGEKVKSSYASSDDDGLHPVADWHTVPYSVPAPTLPMLQTAYARESPYETMAPAPATTSPHNPFLLPNSRHDTTTTTSSSTQHHSSVSQESSDFDGTLVSPISPVEMPAEVGSDRVWHAKPGAKRSRATALWPSRTESSKFDFGFGGRNSSESSSKRIDHQIFQVPRRPVGRL